MYIFLFVCRAEEFAAVFIEVMQQDKNGAVWLIDGGKYTEIEYKNHWFDNAKKSSE